MFPLTDEQVAQVETRLEKGGVRTARLKTDLLDHICCFIEQKLQREEDFDAVCNEAFEILAPGGLQEIEEELFFLFHIHKQLTMKRILFFSGFTTSFLISTGLTFKMLAWPGATIILFCGFLALIFTMVIILANGIKHISAHSPAYRFRIFAGFFAGVAIAAGSIFKILHYPGANVMTLLGMVTLNLAFLPAFFLQLYNQSASSTRTPTGV